MLQIFAPLAPSLHYYQLPCQRLGALLPRYGANLSFNLSFLPTVICALACCLCPAGFDGLPRTVPLAVSTVGSPRAYSSNMTASEVPLSLPLVPMMHALPSISEHRSYRASCGLVRSSTGFTPLS